MDMFFFLFFITLLVAALGSSRRRSASSSALLSFALYSPCTVVASSPPNGGHSAPCPRPFSAEANTQLLAKMEATTQAETAAKNEISHLEGKLTNTCFFW